MKAGYLVSGFWFLGLKLALLACWYGAAVPPLMGLAVLSWVFGDSNE